MTSLYFTPDFQTEAIHITLIFILKSTVLYNAYMRIKPGSQCLNVFRCLFLDACVPEEQDIIRLPSTFNKNWKFQKDRVISMQFPVPSFMISQ